MNISKNHKLYSSIFLGPILLYISAGIYVIVSIICIFRYIHHNYVEGKVFKLNKKKKIGGLKTEVEIVDETYLNYIPAAHIISGLMLIILKSFWFYSSTSFGGLQWALIGKTI